MQKYAYGERVVKQIKMLLSHDQRFKDIVGQSPDIHLDDKFYIESVCWNYYDLQILATRRGIYFSQRGQRQLVMSYNGFDSILI